MMFVGMFFVIPLVGRNTTGYVGYFLFIEFVVLLPLVILYAKDVRKSLPRGPGGGGVVAFVTRLLATMLSWVFGTVIGFVGVTIAGWILYVMLFEHNAGIGGSMIFGLAMAGLVIIVVFSAAIPWRVRKTGTEPDGYWFRSTLFKVVPGEDGETNPYCYGKALATWLKLKLSDCGYDVEEIIPEDWGWCVMCSRKPYLVWVGCGSIVDDDLNEDATDPPSPESIVWHCFPVVEVPFLRKVFRAGGARPALERLAEELEKILKVEPGIVLVDAP